LAQFINHNIRIFTKFEIVHFSTYQRGKNWNSYCKSHCKHADFLEQMCLEMSKSVNYCWAKIKFVQGGVEKRWWKVINGGHCVIIMKFTIYCLFRPLWKCTIWAQQVDRLLQSILRSLKTCQNVFLSILDVQVILSLFSSRKGKLDCHSTFIIFVL